MNKYLAAIAAVLALTGAAQAADEQVTLANVGMQPTMSAPSQAAAKQALLSQKWVVQVFTPGQRGSVRQEAAFREENGHLVGDFKWYNDAWTVDATLAPDGTLEFVSQAGSKFVLKWDPKSQVFVGTSVGTKGSVFEVKASKA